MAWVREKQPIRKVSAPTRDPKAELEGLLSFFACKPSPNANLQRHLTQDSPERRKKVKVVDREPTEYDEDDEDGHEPAPITNQKQRNDHHPHPHQHDHSHDHSHDSGSPPRRTPAARHVSNFERPSQRQRTTAQTRRVVSSWSNATTPLDI